MGKRRSSLFGCAWRGTGVLLSDGLHKGGGTAANYCNAEDSQGKLGASAGK